MNETDRSEFAEALAQLFAIYNDELTKRVLNAWWGVLHPYNLSAIMAAMNLHAGDPDRGMFRPTPADIRRHLERTIPTMIGEKRDSVLRDARARAAPHRDRIERIRCDVTLKLIDAKVADALIAEQVAKIQSIMARPEVVAAVSPQASLRAAESVGPLDRVPAIVRKALNWIGKKA